MNLLLQIIILGENWDEELRRKLYECLYQSYDYAFQRKYLNVKVPIKISNLMKNILISLVTQDINKGAFDNLLNNNYLNMYLI